MPILGVCLGHQALGHYYNAKVDLAPYGPVHGLISPVYYTPTKDKIDDDGNVDLQEAVCDLFRDIPQSFNVVRYHSLVVDFEHSHSQSNSPLMIEPMAWCKSDTAAESGGEDDEICMALRHKVYPHYGVQFHPESVGTGEYGYKILQNFCNFCLEQKAGRTVTSKEVNGNDGNNGMLVDALDSERPKASTEYVNGREKYSPIAKYKVFVHKMSNDGRTLPMPEAAFEEMFATMQDSFWLDSSTGRKDADLEELRKPSAFGDAGGCPIVSNSRFSIMGGNLGPLCKKIEYWGKDHKVDNRGLVVTDQMTGQRNKIDCDQDIIPFLHDEIMVNGVTENVIGVNFNLGQSDGAYDEVEIELPFEYHGGYVGYLGYEVWHDTRDTICELGTCGVTVNDKETIGCSNPLVPTAAFLFADRSLVYDHWKDEWYLVGVVDASVESKEGVVQWMRNTSDQLTSMPYLLQSRQETNMSKAPQKEDLNFNLKRSRNEYSADIERCHEEIKNGESYELCLTNQISTQVSFPNVSEASLTSTPFGLYKILRKNNPAPFAAFMKFDSSNGGNANTINSAVSICCSSPERFLSVKKEGRIVDENDAGNSKDHGWEFAPPFVSKDVGTKSKYIVETKPIKGTASRILISKNDPDERAKVEEDRRVAEELQKSVKNRAENLMIVDLLRNDLSRVCEPGSVHVPKLMGIESFATVHQMVSTIRGIVDQKYTPIDVIASCFPGGSMTGAPKLRSVDILHGLELGQSRGPYSGSLGYISLNGSMDMNIVIRTAVVTPNALSDDEDSVLWDVAIGAGGAITALSESQDEFEEMLLKARAIRKSVEQWNSGEI